MTETEIERLLLGLMLFLTGFIAGLLTKHGGEESDEEIKHKKKK